MAIDVVVNLRAAQLRRRPQLVGRIERAVARRGRVWVTRSIEDLDRAAGEMAAAPPRAVILCGGDGSFMAGVTALERAFDGRPPPVALAPAGTAGTVARNWNRRTRVMDVLRYVLDGGHRGATERPTLRVRDERSSRLGFTFGTGLVARFFDAYYESGAGGYSTAARLVARIFVGSFTGRAFARQILDPLPCRLAVDGRELPPAGYSLIVCSVMQNVGLHMMVTYRGGESFERPHLVATPLSAMKLGPQMPRVLLGRRLRGAGNFDGLVDRFEVRFAGGEGPYVLDGDRFRAEAVTVSAGPRIEVLDV